MKKETASKLLRENVKNQNLVKHCLAVGEAMRQLADFFGENAEQWTVCGLLHDIDYEETKDDPSFHSAAGSKILKDLGLPQDVCQAVLTHNEAHGLQPGSLMAKALYCADPLTGLIVAAVLVLPSKKIADLTVENVLNRFKEKSFARSVNREIISQCQEYLGLNLEKFVEIVLGAMQRISNELEL